MSNSHESSSRRTEKLGLFGSLKDIGGQIVDIFKGKLESDKRERFISILPVLTELIEEVGLGEHLISEEDGKISNRVKMALDKGISRVTVKIDTNGSYRVRTNPRGYGAIGDLIINVEAIKNGAHTYQAGAGGGRSGEKDLDFRWINPISVSPEGMWDNQKFLEVLVDTLDGLIAVLEIQNAQKKSGGDGGQRTPVRN